MTVYCNFYPISLKSYDTKSLFKIQQGLTNATKQCLFAGYYAVYMEYIIRILLSVTSIKKILI